MRLVFAGTPEFSAQLFRQLVEHPRLSHHPDLQWVGVLTQPIRPQGRGRHPEPSAVHTLAETLNIPVRTPVSLLGSTEDGTATQAWLSDCRPDLVVVVAYGLLMPPAVLQTPRYGCLNVHTSLLPRWRGAAPIQRALAANDPETGICLMQMEKGLDTGPIWSQRSLSISPTDNFGSLSGRLLEAAVALLADFLLEWPFGRRAPQLQSDQGIVYAHKITREDQALRLDLSALEVFGQVRALDPTPAARTSHNGTVVKCGGARLVTPHGSWGAPGTVVAMPSEHTGLQLACGQGIVALSWLQQSGGKRLEAREFCRGYRIKVGDRFGT